MSAVVEYPDDPLRTFPTSDPYVRRAEFGTAGLVTYAIDDARQTVTLTDVTWIGLPVSSLASGRSRAANAAARPPRVVHPGQRGHNRFMWQLRGRVAVVTGAASGIGLAIAEAFVREGMRVVMADVNERDLRLRADELARQRGEVYARAVDVRDPEAVDGAGAAAVDRFGALHVAVNNAGVVSTGYSWELPLDEWHRVIDIDLWGVIHGIRAFVPRILASGEEGHVVNVASLAAVMALGRLGPYTAAKHGVLGLTDVLSAEFAAMGAPVGASVVMPGMIKTALNPLGTVEPSVVAANVIDAIRNNRRYVFTDQHSRAEVEERLGAILAARTEVCS